LETKSGTLETLEVASVPSILDIIIMRVMLEEEAEEEDVFLQWSLKGTSRYCTYVHNVQTYATVIGCHGAAVALEPTYQ
jgi:hypothetical protein